MGAELNRIARNSSTRADFLAGREIFIGRLRRSGTPGHLIRLLHSRDPLLKQCVTRILRRQTPNPLRLARDILAEQECQRARVIWLPIPYHPVFEKSCVKSCMRQFCSETWWRSLYAMAYGHVQLPPIESAPILRIAWKLQGKTHMSLLRWLGYDRSIEREIFERFEGNR